MNPSRSPARLLMAFLITQVVGGLCLAAPVHASPWLHDFAQAEAQAKRLGKPMLLHFHASWCGPCRRMEAEVLNSPELQAFLSQKVVAVKIDFDRHPDIGRRFNVQALPHDLLISPEGRILSRTEGYQTKSAYLATVTRGEAHYAQQRIAQQPRPTSKPVAKEQVTSPAPAAQTELASASVTERKPDEVKTDSAVIRLNEPQPAIGLDGYCPVSLWNSREWKRGDEKFSMEFQGITYHFAGASELEQFQQNPTRYAPQLLGCDPVVLWETDRAIAGTSQYGAYYDGELYLFESPESRSRFRANPPRYTKTRHVLKTDAIVRK